MIVIDQREWAHALYSSDGAGVVGSTNMSEYTLRYIKKNDIECLDLTDYNIRDALKLKGFTYLGELDCSSELKLNLITKDYNDHSRNDITSLDLSECPNLRKLNCSGNTYLTILNIRNCSNLKEINVIGCRYLSVVICDNTPYSSTEI